MISMLDRKYETKWAMFYIDSEDDLKLLPNNSRSGVGEYKTLGPCVPGSKAVMPDGTQYMLNGNNEWTVYTTSNGNGGGGNSGAHPDDSDTFVPIDDEVIEGLFSEDSTGNSDIYVRIDDDTIKGMFT